VVITVLAFDVPAGLAPAWDPEPVLLLLLLHAATSSAAAASEIPAMAATGIRAGDKLVMILSVPRHAGVASCPAVFLSASSYGPAAYVDWVRNVTSITF
jgi:hypothetical protein